MHLLLVGLNHETAPLPVRERVAFSPHGTLSALLSLKEQPELSEIALLSTCNRTELYAMIGTPEPRPLVRFLEETAASSDLHRHLYTREGADAARHLFRVASGLDSMILGEGQILSQVKGALQQATEAGALGGRLSALFRFAIVVGKRSRSETSIARGAVSISNAAVQLARELFGDLRDNTALILGAGETAELTLRLLNEAGVRSVVVANRTYHHAVSLTEALGGKAIPFSELAEIMAGADIVIGSTAAPHPVIRRDLVQAVMRKRRGRPLFLIDIAVPRDIEPAVGNLENVFLYNLDDLQRVVEENLEGRASEVAQVEAIIDAELRNFLEAWNSLSLGPLLSALKEKLEEIRQEEMERSRRKLANLSESELVALDLLTRGILNRVLREPIAQLKKQGDSPVGALYMDALRVLFGLPEDLHGPVLPMPGEQEPASPVAAKTNPTASLQEDALSESASPKSVERSSR